jgi:hypothetical protein
LVLVAVPPHVERILEMLKLTELLPVLKSVDAASARAPFNGRAPRQERERPAEARPKLRTTCDAWPRAGRQASQR